MSRLFVNFHIFLVRLPLTRCHCEDKYIFEGESTFDSEWVSQLGGSEGRHLKEKIWDTCTNLGTKFCLCYVHCTYMLAAYANVLREQFQKVNGQLNKDRAKGKTLRGKHCWSSRRPYVKKPLKTRVKHPKCCNHYLDKDRTHIVPVNKSVPKTEPVDKILKGLIKVSWGAFWS